MCIRINSGRRSDKIRLVQKAYVSQKWLFISGCFLQSTILLNHSTIRLKTLTTFYKEIWGQNTGIVQSWIMIHTIAKPSRCYDRETTYCDLNKVVKHFYVRVYENSLGLEIYRQKPSDRRKCGGRTVREICSSRYLESRCWNVDFEKKTTKDSSRRNIAGDWLSLWALRRELIYRPYLHVLCRR